MAFRSSYGPDRGFGQGGDGEDDVFRVPDKDVYRKNISSFGSIHTYLESRFHVRKHADRRIMQPHYTHLKHIMTPYGNRANPADGVCTKFLRKGLIKPNKIQMNVAVWSADSRWLVLGTQSGDIALWEGDTLKVRLLLCIFLCLDLPTTTHLFTLPLLYVPWGPAGPQSRVRARAQGTANTAPPTIPRARPPHSLVRRCMRGTHTHTQVLEGDRVKESIPITAMAWNNHGNVVVTGDSRGVMQYCDETFRNITVISEAHRFVTRHIAPKGLLATSPRSPPSPPPSPPPSLPPLAPSLPLTHASGAVRGLSYSPLDSKLVSGSDDALMHIWGVGQHVPERTLTGHQSDVKGAMDCAAV
jgi:WD40 repeat protein